MLSNTPKPMPLDIEPGDLPLVHEAFTIQACTEFMCGRPQARARLEALMGQVARGIPDCAKAFDGGDWAVIAAIVKAGGQLEITVLPPDWNQYSREGYVTVRIGEATWRSKDCRHKLDSPIAAEIRDYLNSIS